MMTLDDAIKEIQQPRSKFQLERFVVGQHPTIEMQYYQTLIELQNLITNQKLAEINLKKQQIKISRLRATQDELDELEAQELEIGLDQTKTAMIGNEREIEHLISIWESFPIKFTRDEIESAQLSYWKARLTNNAEAQILSNNTISAPHLETMKQAGILESFLKQRSAQIAGDENEIRNLESKSE